MHKKGISLNSVDKSLSHSADKIRRRTLMCFERILVSKIFKQRRGKLHGFVEIFFISQDRKNFGREPFCVSENSFMVGKNFLWIRGWYHDFLSKSLCLTVPKYFIGEHFVVSEKLFYQKFSCIGGGASRFYRNFLSHRTEAKSFVKEPFCCPENFRYRKKIMDKRGHITIFSRNFYVSRCRKIS